LKSVQPDLQGFSHPRSYLALQKRGDKEVRDRPVLDNKNTCLQVFLINLSPLTDSNRRPLLTMRSSRQLVATDGNGFALFPPLRGSGDLRLIATGCHRGAP
jgi:hypothetical protein